MVFVSEEISSYLNSLVVQYEEDPQMQLFENVVLPPQTFRHYPLVYLWSPLKRFNFKNLTTEMSQSPSMKRAKREDYKYCKMRTSNFIEEKTGGKSSGMWTLLEVVVLHCSVQMPQRMGTELCVKQITEWYNLISGRSDLNTNQFSVRRKSENQM